MNETEDSNVVCSEVGESFVVFDRDNRDAWLMSPDGVDVILQR